MAIDTLFNQGIVVNVIIIRVITEKRFVVQLEAGDTFVVVVVVFFITDNTIITIAVFAGGFVCRTVSGTLRFPPSMLSRRVLRSRSFGRQKRR